MIRYKVSLTDLKHPLVQCPRGHSYRVPLRYYNRNVRRKRGFVCPKCMTSFKIKVGRNSQ